MDATSGRAWSRLGFTVGITASVAANVAHSYVVRTDPPVGAIVSAAFWPLALLISLEVISRVSWPRGWYWWVARYAGLTTVALIAAIVSYQHMAGLLRSYGEDGFSSTVGPIAVDGLMVICSVALLAIADNLRHKRQEVAATPMPSVPAAAETILRSQSSPTPNGKTISDPEPVVATPVIIMPRPEPTIQERATEAYQDSVQRGKPYTGTELGARFNRSPRWGRQMIQQVKKQ